MKNSLIFATAICLTIGCFSAFASAQSKSLVDQRKIERAFRAKGGRNGETTLSVYVPKERRSHGFNLRSIRGFKRKGNRLTLKGLMWHRHTGYDDKIHFVVIVEKGKKPHYRITDITYRGITKSGKTFDLRKVAKLVPVGGEYVDVVASFIQSAEIRLRRKTEGKWEVAAQMIVEAVAKRLDKEVNVRR